MLGRDRRALSGWAGHPLDRWPLLLHWAVPGRPSPTDRNPSCVASGTQSSRWEASQMQSLGRTALPFVSAALGTVFGLLVLAPLVAPRSSEALGTPPGRALAP